MIGLFDSGYGGLTILQGMVKALPQYSYMYLGDNARAPYGSRSSEEIFAFTRQGVEYLFAHGCELIVLACNTASATALRRLQKEVLPQKYPDKKILGILVPTIEQITGVPWQQITHSMSAIGVATVGVLATEATVQSGAYAEEIHKRNSSIQVLQQSCPGLVEAIEAGEDESVLRTLVQGYLDQLYAQAPGGAESLSAILLGCTHYALIADLIRSQLPAHVHIYEQPQIVANSLKKYLEVHPEIAQGLDQSGQRQFFTTGDPADINHHSARYFGAPITFSQIKLG